MARHRVDEMCRFGYVYVNVCVCVCVANRINNEDNLLYNLLEASMNIRTGCAPVQFVYSLMAALLNENALTPYSMYPT